MTPKQPPGDRPGQAPITKCPPIDNPLDFIAADHAAERDCCLLIERIAGADHPLPEDASRVRSFLLGAFRLHLRDEEDDLFPLLQRRCAPEDEIDRILGAVRRDHSHPRSDLAEITPILEAVIRQPDSISEVDRQRLIAYATLARRHLAVENAIILPIARARLGKNDLEALRARMQQRRCLDGDRHAG